ncbi:MocR-like pyridoxine biosynthesis transcription factor PdxR [Phenylobacterium soli]|nr:PLP-dependent aminotransferase family protein [Phenylobacterium soli]
MQQTSWADLYAWRPPQAGEPVIRQVYDQVREAIHAGALLPGGRLPSSRGLAEHLGVARASVVAAYDLLQAEGYIEGRRGSGAFVAGDLSGVLEVRRPAAEPEPAATPEPPPRVRELAELTLPAGAREPQLFTNGRTLMDARAQDAWSRATRKALRCLDPIHFGYTEPAGMAELRAVIADYLRAARGVVCEPDQVVLTAGAQHAADLAARILLEPGAPVWVEDPCYEPTWRALTAVGARLHPIPVDRAGLDVAAGVAIAPDARMAFITPSTQYPLGVTLSMARRLELIAWARAAGAWIVEDDYASEFRYSGPPLASLQGLDGGERVIYVGTFNKSLFPGLRLGYLVAPKPLAAAFATARGLVDRQPPTISQAIVLEFMQSGDFAAHVRRRRLAYRDQRDALVAALEGELADLLEVDVPDQGMHLMAFLQDGRSDVAVQAAAAQRGLVVRPISRLYHDAPPRSGLMLGFTGFPAQAMLPGVGRLARVLRETTC